MGVALDFRAKILAQNKKKSRFQGSRMQIDSNLKASIRLPMIIPVITAVNILFSLKTLENKYQISMETEN